MNPLVILPYLVAYSLLAAIGWTLWSAIRDTLAVAKQMHQIPCPTCRYFTDDHRLKCPVQPRIANTERSDRLFDYRPLH